MPLSSSYVIWGFSLGLREREIEVLFKAHFQQLMSALGPVRSLHCKRSLRLHLTAALVCGQEYLKHVLICMQYLRPLIEINNFKNRNTSILTCIQFPVSNTSVEASLAGPGFPNHTQASFLGTLYREIFIFSC